MSDFLEEIEQEYGLTPEERKEAAKHMKPPAPGKLNPLVCAQDKVWYDIKGEPHTIDSMDYEYVLNVLCFCYEHRALRGSFALKGGFQGSPLQKKLHKRLHDACELAWQYEELAD